MTLYTTEYAKLQTEFHKHRQDYGTSGQKYSEFILDLAKKLNTRDILDYACGKATLQKSIPYPIQNYDPFVEEYSRRPVPADLVVCTDTLEHIEPECIGDVLLDIHALTKQMLFLQIATRPAAKFLPDGRNAHLTQEGVNWWLPHILKHFDLRNLNDQNGGFISIWTPKPYPEIVPC